MEEKKGNNKYELFIKLFSFIFSKTETITKYFFKMKKHVFNVC